MAHCDKCEQCEQENQQLKHKLRVLQSELQGVPTETVAPPKAIADLLVEGVEKNNIALVARLLLSRWEINTVLEGGSSLLHIAASSSVTSACMCQLLISHGADPSLKDHAGLTCIERANKAGYLERMQEAMAEELALAAERDDPKLVEVLLRAGVPVDSTVENQETALHKAAAAGHVSVCEKLIEWKANLEAADKNGKTPIAHAYANGKYRAGRILLKSGAKTPTDIDSTPPSKTKLSAKAKSRLQMLASGIRLRALGSARHHSMSKYNRYAVEECDADACEDMEHRMYREFITHQRSCNKN